MKNLKITNIKLSLKTTFILLDSVKKLLKNQNIDFKEYPNYIVLKNKYTYVYFKSACGEINHLNITNVKNFKDIDSSVNYFLNVLMKSLEISEVYRRVDNISASLNLNLTLNLLDIVNYFEKVCCVSYNTEKFPGVFLKFEKGTIIVFYTGKCIFIGCKNSYNLKCLENHIQNYVNTKIKS